MGLDFMIAATELPPHPKDDDETDAIVAKITSALMDQDVLEAIVSDKFYDLLVGNDWVTHHSWDELTADADWDAIRNKVAASLESYLRGYWRGENSRCYAELDTYDKDGNKIVLTVSGEMSYGDVHESLDFLWTFEYLPEKWWI